MGFETPISALIFFHQFFYVAMVTRLKNYFKMENRKNPYCFDNGLTKSPTQPITPPHHYISIQELYPCQIDHVHVHVP